MKSILEKAARSIYRLFGFKEVSIGLKDKKDGLYRYEVLIDFTRDSQEAHRRLEYTYDEFMDASDYPYFRLGKFCDFNISEDMEYRRDDDRKTFNRTCDFEEETREYG